MELHVSTVQLWRVRYSARKDRSSGWRARRMSAVVANGVRKAARLGVIQASRRTSRPLSSTASGLSRRRTLSLSNAQTEARYGHPQHCRRRNPGESSSRSSTSGTSSNPITKPEKWATISDKDGTGIMVESAAELFGGSISLGDGVGVTSAVRVAPPTRAQLKTLFIQSAVPMVGFGIMDNFVMLSAGDLIDNTLGVKFGLATLTAAACGQVVSDVCGVCFGGTVEALAMKLGLPSSDLSLHQRGLRVSRLTATSGAAVGVVVGCLLGMTTLFFIDTTSADREKKQREMDTLFATIMDHGHQIVGAEKCSMFFVDEEKQELWTKVATDEHGAIKTGKMITIPITTGIVGEVVRTKKIRNVADTSKDSKFFGGVDQAMKTETKNLLAVPVISQSTGVNKGKVIAVIEMMNKDGPFDDTDEKLVSMLAAHMSAFMKQLSEGSNNNEYETAKPITPM